jgi:hypothetical protein
MGRRHVTKQTERSVGPEGQRRAVGGSGISPQQIFTEINVDGFEGLPNFRRWLRKYFIGAQDANRSDNFITFRPELLLNRTDQVFASLPAKRLQVIGRECVINVARTFKPHRQNLHMPVVRRLRHETFVHGPKRRLAAGSQSGQHQQTSDADALSQKELLFH